MGQVTVTRRGICEIHNEAMAATLLQSFGAVVAPCRYGDYAVDLLLQPFKGVKYAVMAASFTSFRNRQRTTWRII